MVLNATPEHRIPWRVAGPALLLAALAVYAGFAWRNRDIRHISRRLEALSAALARAPDESPLSGLVRAKEISNYFTEAPRVEPGWPLPILTSREELAAAAHQLRSNLSEFRVIVRDKTIRLAEDRQSAEVDVTVEGVLTYQGEPVREIRSFHTAWQKVKKNWRIARVEPLEIIRRPAPPL